MRSRPALWMLVGLSTALSGCRYLRPVPETDAEAQAEAQAEAAAPTPTGAAAPATRSMGRVSDANIAAMLMAQNNTDISYARLVPSRAQRADVRDFAERMLTDHTGINGLVNDLLVKLDMAPEDNVASLDMRDESATRRDLMRDLSGFAFDSVYITNEVSYHQKFLASIDNVMLPAARHADLRSLLTTIRPAVAAHLAHAEQVWANVMARK
jgi:putative membrane protein